MRARNSHAFLLGGTDMRGHIRKRGTTWSAVVYLGYDNDTGKKKYKWFGGFGTKKEAEKFLAVKTQELHDGSYMDPSQEPLSNYLVRWLDHKKDFVRPRTVYIYERTIRLHITPSIGRIPLCDLKPIHLRDLYSGLQRKKSLSARYVSQIHNMLHDALDTAVKWEMVTRNVSDAVEPPKPVRMKFDVWTIDDVRKFLTASEVREHRFYMAFLLALTTGMRQGEILGLRWSDIDLDKSILHVRHSLGFINGEFVLGPPKSESGERDITLPLEVVEALKQHKAKQNEDRLLYGSAYEQNELVVCRRNGNFVTQTFIRAKFTALIKQLDMPYIRFHDLRHTHSSMLLELGEDMKTLQDRLGHATYAITADIYTHVSPTLRTRPAQLISDALFTQRK